MKSIGKFGEYRVLACLLERDIEAYQALDITQPDYDITAIISANKIVRIQVKSTDLHNAGTNNAIARIDKNYDFLVVVIFENKSSSRFFIMSKAEAIAEKGVKKQLGVTQKRNKISQVKQSLIPFEDRWEKIENA